MVFSGIIQPEYKDIVKQMNLEEEIGPRIRLSIEEYERLHGNGRNPDDSIIHPHKEFILMKVGGYSLLIRQDLENITMLTDIYRNNRVYSLMQSSI